MKVNEEVYSSCPLNQSSSAHYYRYLRAGDNYTDECVVVSSCTLHAPVETLGKVARTTANTHHWGREGGREEGGEREREREREGKREKERQREEERELLTL